jgi:copper chaperone CopZ
MKQLKSENNHTSNMLSIAGLTAAVASSLCCIGPLVALLSGVSGVASTFSWIEPVRPWLMIGSGLALAFAFREAYKPTAVDDCNCEVPAKKKFFQTKSFVWTIAALSVVMFSFPYYSGALLPAPSSEYVFANSSNHLKATINIEGMTCTGCENHVQSALLLTGAVDSASANYEMGSAFATYDPEQISPEELKRAIEVETGYTVTDIKIKD